MTILAEELEAKRKTVEQELRLLNTSLREESTRAENGEREVTRLQQVVRSLERAVSTLLEKEAAGRRAGGDACTRWTQTLLGDVVDDEMQGSAVHMRVDVAVGEDARGASASPRRSLSSASSPRVVRRSASPEVRPMFRLNVPLPSVSKDRGGTKHLHSTSSEGGGGLRRSSTPFLSTSRGVSFARPETPRVVSSGSCWRSVAVAPVILKKSASPGASTVAETAREPSCGSSSSTACVAATARQPSISLVAARVSQPMSVAKVKLSLPPGVLDKKYAGVRDAFAELRGLVLRADASMFMTLASVHTLRDCGCPLKLSIAKIKQTILAACPALCKRIKDGLKWDVQRSDLMGLGEEAAGPIAASLREMVAAHDYLRYHQRTESLQSALNEVYENIELWIQLARSRRVQLIIN